MKLTRRNALIGLGSLVAGSGALVGTGAFSSVEANRTVTVSTADDASAYLGLTGDDEYIADDSDGVLTIDLGNGNALNKDAVTTLDGVVTITNQAEEGESYDIGFEDDDGNQAAKYTITTSDGEAEVTFYMDGDPSTGGTVTSGASVPSVGDGSSAEVDVEVDTTVSSSTGDNSGLTILAKDTSPEDSSGA